MRAALLIFFKLERNNRLSSDCYQTDTDLLTNPHFLSLSLRLSTSLCVSLYIALALRRSVSLSLSSLYRSFLSISLSLSSVARSLSPSFSPSPSLPQTFCPFTHITLLITPQWVQSAAVGAECVSTCMWLHTSVSGGVRLYLLTKQHPQTWCSVLTNSATAGQMNRYETSSCSLRSAPPLRRRSRSVPTPRHKTSA